MARQRAGVPLGSDGGPPGGAGRPPGGEGGHPGGAGVPLCGGGGPPGGISEKVKEVFCIIIKPHYTRKINKMDQNGYN